MPRAARRLGAPVALAVMLLAGASGALAGPASVSRAHANTVADAILLRPGDLAGYKQEPNPMTAHERALSAQEARCIGGVPPSEAWAQSQSPGFTRTLADGASTTVSSQAELLPSAALVDKDLAAASGPHGIPCLQTELVATLRASLPKGQSLVSISGAGLAAPLPKADPSFADRFTILIAVKQGGKSTKVPVYADAVGITDGQVEIALSVEAVLTPPPAAFEHQLAEVLLARAQAQLG